MNRAMAERLGVLLSERGYEWSINRIARQGKPTDEYAVHYYTKPDGSMKRIIGSSLVSDQHWLEGDAS